MATSMFQVSPGIMCKLKDNSKQYRYGVEITLKGCFRHGGLEHTEIRARLEKAFSELDLDMNIALEERAIGEHLRDNGTESETK